MTIGLIQLWISFYERVQWQNKLLRRSADLSLNRDCASDQCDQIGRISKVLGNKFSYKILQLFKATYKNITL